MSKNWTYKSGDWNVICDVCSKKIKASESLKRWDGFVVCKADFENRHSMDFIRARADKISVPFTRPQSTDTFVIATCSTFTNQGMANYGTADCSRADINYNETGYCITYNEGDTGDEITFCYATPSERASYLATSPSADRSSSDQATLIL